MNEVNSLYVHIPFCKNICYYCDFCKMYYQEKWIDDYLNALNDELISYQANRPFQTVFIGGGSPSVLSLEELEKLFAILKLPLSSCIEATIEVNPEDLTEKKAELLKRAGINRVSLGVQTFNDELLKKVGRTHSFETIKNSYQLLLDAGIDNISFDFIYGLENQTMDDLKNDLEKLSYFKELKHVSFYSLILEEHTILNNQNVKLKDDDWLLEASNLIEQQLEVLGYHRYEVSNYAKKGYESIHNSVYWHNENYIGIGLGASGFIGNLRYDNTRSLSHYLKHQPILYQYELSLEDQMFEHLMVGLRLCEGIDINLFTKRYQKNVFETFDQLQDYVNQGFLELENNYLRTTKRGMDILDELLVGIM